jgi:hypothetical protein
MTNEKIRLTITDDVEAIGMISSTMFISYIKTLGGSIFSKYTVTDDMIIAYLEHFDREVLLGHVLSERVVTHLMEIGYIDEKGIYGLTMATYANFSETTIRLYKDILDLDKLLSLKISNDTIKSSDIDLYVSADTSDNMWELISTCKLDIKFLKKYKKNINWFVFLKTNVISDDIRNEFSDFLEKYDTKPLVNESEDFVNYISSIMELDSNAFDDLITNMNNNK